MFFCFKFVTVFDLNNLFFDVSLTLCLELFYLCVIYLCAFPVGHFQHYNNRQEAMCLVVTIPVSEVKLK